MECSQWTIIENLQEARRFVFSDNTLKSYHLSLGSAEITDVTFVVVNNNRSILAVGWDKCVNVFKDEYERNRQLCYPEDRFGGDRADEGHTEDILCIARSYGDLIATGDYGGTILIWNLSSKKVFAVLREDKENKIVVDGRYLFIEYDRIMFCKENSNDRVIRRIIFIDSRYFRRDVANLIAGGPYGHIHFWNIYRNGVLMAKFRPVKIR